MMMRAYLLFYTVFACCNVSTFRKFDSSIYRCFYCCIVFFVLVLFCLREVGVMQNYFIFNNSYLRSNFWVTLYSPGIVTVCFKLSWWRVALRMFTRVYCPYDKYINKNCGAYFKIQGQLHPTFFLHSRQNFVHIYILLIGLKICGQLYSSLRVRMMMILFYTRWLRCCVIILWGDRLMFEPLMLLWSVWMNNRVWNNEVFELFFGCMDYAMN